LRTEKFSQDWFGLGSSLISTIAVKLVEDKYSFDLQDIDVALGIFGDDRYYFDKFP
jgi:hypothetical protein